MIHAHMDKMVKREDKYLQFPVWLLKNAFLDTQTTFKDILIAGAFWYMKKNNICYTEALRYHDLNIGPDTFARGCEIFNNTPGGEALPNIKLSHAEEFATTDKSELEVAMVLMYVAIKSILGMSAVKKVT